MLRKLSPFTFSQRTSYTRNKIYLDPKTLLVIHKYPKPADICGPWEPERLKLIFINNNIQRQWRWKFSRNINTKYWNFTYLQRRHWQIGNRYRGCSPQPLHTSRPDPLWLRRGSASRDPRRYRCASSRRPPALGPATIIVQRFTTWDNDNGDRQFAVKWNIWRDWKIDNPQLPENCSVPTTLFKYILYLRSQMGM